MKADWIDCEKQRRDVAQTRALTQAQHAAVNARYLGCTECHCAVCGDQVDEPYAGNYCAGCYEELKR